MSEQLMIDFDPVGTAQRVAAERDRDTAYADLVATAHVSQAEAKEHGLWMPAGSDDKVTVLVCPACGEYEANEFLIANNHGIDRDYLQKRPDGTWATTGREYGKQWCVALELTSRHVAGEYGLTDSQNRMRDRLRPDIRERFDQEIADVTLRLAHRPRRQG